MEKMMDLIERQKAIDELLKLQRALQLLEEPEPDLAIFVIQYALRKIEQLPSAQPEIIRCKDCKHWRQQINYQGTPLSFGFCESEDMWASLYGETCEVEHIDTADNHYCGYAERKDDD